MKNYYRCSVKDRVVFLLGDRSGKISWKIQKCLKKVVDFNKVVGLSDEGNKDSYRSAECVK